MEDIVEKKLIKINEEINISTEAIFEMDISEKPAEVNTGEITTMVTDIINDTTYEVTDVIIPPAEDYARSPTFQYILNKVREAFPEPIVRP